MNINEGYIPMPCGSTFVGEWDLKSLPEMTEWVQSINMPDNFSKYLINEGSNTIKL